MKTGVRALGSIVSAGGCLFVAVSVAAAGTIALHPHDLDVADLYATEVVEGRATDGDAGAALPTLDGLRFSAVDVITAGLDSEAATHQVEEEIKGWTGARTGPFDTNVTLAALVRGSTAVPDEAAPPADILSLALEPGSSVAQMRGPLTPEALAAAIPPTIAGPVSPSPSVRTPAAQPVEPAAPAPAPPPEEERPAPSGPSLLTLVAMAALIITGATTFAVQGDRSHRRPHRHRTPRDF